MRTKKPIPAALHKLHGEPRRRPTVDTEPEGVGDIWAPPGWFDDQQREQWHYGAEHAPAGLLTGTDREILVVWVVAAVEHARACQKVRELGRGRHLSGGTGLAAAPPASHRGADIPANWSNNSSAFARNNDRGGRVTSGFA
jgi:hypothetical protein